MKDVVLMEHDGSRELKEVHGKNMHLTAGSSELFG
jgi:hypothetical protein